MEPRAQDSIEELSLLDLPRELIVKIIEQECITLEDRMNLRLTCKSMEEIVSDSDFFAFSEVLTIQQFAHDFMWDRENSYIWRTRIKGIIRDSKFVKKDKCCVSTGRSISYINLASRLFRRAHFRQIELKQLNFRSDLPMKSAEDRMAVNELLELLNSLSCKIFFIALCPYHYDKRMFDVIHILKPSEELKLAFSSRYEQNELARDEIEDQILLLPPIHTVTFSSYSTILKLSDSTLLSLLTKHCVILAERTWEHLKPETFVISKFDHTLELRFQLYRFFDLQNYFPWLIECLRLMDVVLHGRKMISLDRRVTVTTIHEKDSIDVFDYSIEANGVTITIKRTLDKWSSVVRIERTPEEVFESPWNQQMESV